MSPRCSLRLFVRPATRRLATLRVIHPGRRTCAGLPARSWLIVTDPPGAGVNRLPLALLCSWLAPILQATCSACKRPVELGLQAVTPAPLVPVSSASFCRHYPGRV